MSHSLASGLSVMTTPLSWGWTRRAGLLIDPRVLHCRCSLLPQGTTALRVRQRFTSSTTLTFPDGALLFLHFSTYLYVCTYTFMLYTYINTFFLFLCCGSWHSAGSLLTLSTRDLQPVARNPFPSSSPDCMLIARVKTENFIGHTATCHLPSNELHRRPSPFYSVA